MQKHYFPRVLLPAMWLQLMGEVTRNLVLGGDP